jgi:thioredoxin-dependent peroxiredoxin
MLRINDEAPNFTANFAGHRQFSRMDRQRLGHFVFEPEDFVQDDRVHGRVAARIPEAQLQNHRAERGPVSSHNKWAVDIDQTQGHNVNYPMIGDPELQIAKLYDMLPADAASTCEGRSAATNATVRTVFVIGPDKKLKLMLSHPMSTGRNYEVLRVLDSTQLTAKHQVSTRSIGNPERMSSSAAAFPMRIPGRSFQAVGRRAAALSTDRSAAEAEVRN